ncbi:MAG: 3-deoxy-manno-octulosonate cytidylyltransferase [Gemmataceae bacterium]|nr:3-deoxy-manno-octulosonate cytidylyltransferase [Gemmataceae bacterium]MCS7269822.1 3-deoxy-manno-octulosonate cytidylyltransferase [Gemmataceae bacterium]MDW8243822.1 3-deoxy-manno-octulosonate cytidylyltransferase [Thermogemmata sp.]
MEAVIIIPARYGSSRLPGKPLLRETGKYLIQHVYERAMQVRGVAGVLVATDDPRIVAAVHSFGGQAVLTRAEHPSGTDRIAEVAAQLTADLVVNVQGDEPLIEPAAIEQLLTLLRQDPHCVVATLAAPLRRLADYHNPNLVKVVCDDQGRALYFSRAPIPWHRAQQPDFERQPPLYLQHLGVYAYRRRFLLQLATTPPHPLEQAEQLEQLRALALGVTIRVGIVSHAHKGIDTPADYAEFVQFYRGEQPRQAA